MRFVRYIPLGLFWWGYEPFPDSRSNHPDFTSSSAVGNYGFKFDEESDNERRGCGEDTGVIDTGEVYFTQ